MSLEATGELDAHLSSGPFGSAEFLEENCNVLYEELARLLSDRLGFGIPNPMSVSDLATKIVLRRDLEFAFAELAEGKPVSCVEALRRSSSLRTEPGAGFRHALIHGLTFFSDYSQDGFADDVRRTFMKSMKGEGARVFGVRPSREQLETARSALEWARLILPSTLSGTLSLASAVVLVRGEISSAYINENPFSFFVNATQFADMPLLVETLFHEALHEKMARIRLTSNLLHATYEDLDSEANGDVLVPWPAAKKPRHWSFARALAAFHVYVHTSAFYQQILSEPSASESCGICSKTLTDRSVVQFERARYLHAALCDDRCLSFADLDGTDFLAWTGKVLDRIEPEIFENARPERRPFSWDLSTIRRAAA
ncbi:MAG: hypothetical protein OXH76_22085 [Boseongicola sp.]|nr:hypothetical protein [Boseongicola sp.]